MDSTLWEPSASIATLKKRAELMAAVRSFFQGRGVMEVDVAVLSSAAVSDPFIDAMTVDYRPYAEAEADVYYLQSSPEYAMKRLLAAGSGCIYQLSKVFRNGELGRRHNPEFTMLEWYRLALTDITLMDEIDALLLQVAGISDIARISYHDLFDRYLGINIDRVSIEQLAQKMRQSVDVSGDYDRDGWLNLLMSHCIEPQLIAPTFVYNYPESQSALARLKVDSEGRKVAARFELFIAGVELANGYHELTCPHEQLRRLERDQQQRTLLNLPQRPIETRLVSALEKGVPDCAGVALGFDRLLMLTLGADSIGEVIPFNFERA